MLLSPVLGTSFFTVCVCSFCVLFLSVLVKTCVLCSTGLENSGFLILGVSFLGSSTLEVSVFLGSSGFLGCSTFGTSGFLGSGLLDSSGLFGVSGSAGLLGSTGFGSGLLGSSGFLGSSFFSLVFLIVSTPPLLVTLTVYTSSVALYPSGAVISVTSYSPSSRLSDNAIPLSLDVSSKLLSPLVILNFAPASPFPVSESTFLILNLPLISVFKPPPADLYTHTPAVLHGAIASALSSAELFCIGSSSFTVVA